MKPKPNLSFSRVHTILEFLRPQVKYLGLTPQIKYLGLTIDSKLNWGSTMEERKRKATVVFFVFKKLFGRKWGLRSQMVHWFYISTPTAVLETIQGFQPLDHFVMIICFVGCDSNRKWWTFHRFRCDCPALYRTWTYGRNGTEEVRIFLGCVKVFKCWWM